MLIRGFGGRVLLLAGAGCAGPGQGELGSADGRQGLFGGGCDQHLPGCGHDEHAPCHRGRKAPRSQLGQWDYRVFEP